MFMHEILFLNTGKKSEIPETGKSLWHAYRKGTCSRYVSGAG